MPLAPVSCGASLIRSLVGRAASSQRRSQLSPAPMGCGVQYWYCTLCLHHVRPRRGRRSICGGWAESCRGWIVPRPAEVELSTSRRWIALRLGVRVNNRVHVKQHLTTSLASPLTPRAYRCAPCARLTSSGEHPCQKCVKYSTMPPIPMHVVPRGYPNGYLFPGTPRIF